MNDSQFVDQWNNYPETQPPEIVEEYLTLNSDGIEKVLEWYEGACFIHKIGGGYWVDRDSEDCKEILNVVKWKEIPL